MKTSETLSEANFEDVAASDVEAETTAEEDSAPGGSEEADGQLSELSSHDAAAAFQLRRAEIEAVPNAKANIINTDVGTAVQGVLATVARISPLVDELNREAPTFALRPLLAKLHTVALALNYLQAKYRILLNNRDNEDVVYLGRMRRIFQLDGETLAARGYLNQAQVDELKHTNNHHALAYDVMGLAELILGVYDDPKVKLITTKEELLEASERANRLFSQLGTRQFGPNAGDEIKVLRRKAFSLMMELFGELEAFVHFARRKQGDGKSLLASLYGKRSRKANGSKSTEDIDDAEAAEDSAAADESSDGVPFDVEEINRNVAAATAAPATPGQGVPPGFPGGLPFRADVEEDVQ